MVQRNKTCHVSTAPNGDGAVKNKNGVECSHRQSKEKDKHWDFLDEIDAPMWVNLTQECQSSYQNKDDEWFNISHPFHQCSARELISAFSRPGEGCTNFELCGQEQFSPKFPSSVSRSRGKDYRRREWGHKNQIGTFDLQQSVKDLRNETSSGNSATDKVSSVKTSNVRLIDLASSQSDSIGETRFTEIAGQHNQPVPCFSSQNYSNSISSKGWESTLTGSITSEGSVNQQQKPLEVSRQVLVQTNQLLSELKISLRKSCVTRQASRMLVTEMRQSEVRNSSSSKSSVSSASSHGRDVKSLTARENKDKTRGLRYVTGVSTGSSDNMCVSKSSKAPAARPWDITSKPNLRSQSFTLSSINQEATKAKVQQQSVPRKVLVPHRVNECLPLAVTTQVGGKASATGDLVPVGGKENRAWEFAVSQKKLNPKMKATKDIGQVQKLPETCGKTKLVGQKESSGGRSKGKKFGTTAEKAYFR